ncbi:sensor histidine kinase [Actinophytocola sp.]|uniref:sensor histidine kinase n=1 Tax=Actinophytocola sp. TaxID=1872138 RepID=UPI00389B29DB
MLIRRLGLGATVAALFTLGVLDLVQHYGTRPFVAMVLSAVRVAPLFFYRRRPVAAWVAVLAAAALTAGVSEPVSRSEPWPWAVTNVMAVTAVAGMVASLGRRNLSLTMFGILAGGYLVLAFWPGGGDNWATGVVVVVTSGIAMIVGDFVHGRSRMAAELVRERQVSATERELRSVVEERARIARELHDVVAHHMSMITVQAETARFRHRDLPPEAVTEFAEIANVARTSLSELRGLLSALRDDGADPNRTPQPTLADVPALVDRITAAGTPVTLTLTAETADLPQIVQLAAYRIVQEGLSNVVRHAGKARTWVDIVRSEEALHLEVTNERPTPQPSPATDARTHSHSQGQGQGHGLTGLRERATLLGGTFEVDHPAGGWRLRASLPL